MNSTTKVIAKFVNEEFGMEASVVQIPKGFSVALRDMDADEFVGICKIFRTEADAIAYAKTV